MKRKVFDFILKVLKIPAGVQAPAWLTWIFFPLMSFGMKHSPIKYDFSTDVFTIGKMRYSGILFKAWELGIPIGECFKIVSRKDGVLTVERLPSDYAITGKNAPPDKIDPDSGYNALWGWFGLSRASWLAIPRALMHEMPDEWQAKMAALLNEWDDHWDWPDDIGDSAVFRRDENGRLSRWPDWILQYRHPLTDMIESIKRKPLREDFLTHKRISVDKPEIPGLF